MISPSQSGDAARPFNMTEYNTFLDMSDTNKTTPAPGAAPVKKTTTTAPKSTPAPKAGASTTGSASTAAAKTSADPKSTAAPKQAATGGIAKPLAESVSGAQPSSAPAPEQSGAPSGKVADIATPEGAALYEETLGSKSPDTKGEVTLDSLKTVETTETTPTAEAEVASAPETDEEIAVKNDKFKKDAGNFTSGKSKEDPIVDAIGSAPEPLFQTNGAESLVSIEGAIQALKTSPKGATIVATGDVIEKVANCGHDWEGYGFEVDDQLIQTNPYGFYIK